MTTATVLRAVFLVVSGLAIIVLAVLEVLAGRLAPPSTSWAPEALRFEQAHECCETARDPWLTPDRSVAATRPAVSRPIAVHQ